MSLTGLLNTNKEFREFFKSIKPSKKDFYTLSGKTPFSKEYIEKVPYNLDVSYNSTLLGTAFDYLARFEIARNIDNGKKIVYEMLYHGRPAGGLDSISFALGYKSILKSLEKEFNNSLNIVKKYVNLEVDDFNILLEKVLFLARLEHFDRSGALGAVHTFRNMEMHPQFNVLVTNDFKYEKGDRNKKMLCKNNIISKDFINVNGENCRITFSYDDMINVSLDIECYDKLKNLLEIKK